MSNLLALFGFFNEVTNIVISCVTALAVILCVVFMLKFKESRKIVLYVLAFIIIFIGSLSGFGLYKDLTAKSIIVGSLDYDQLTTTQSMTYSKSSLILYTAEEDNTCCYFEDTMSLVKDFNGNEHNYIVTLNDYVLTESSISAGSIYSIVNFVFYDTDNSVKCNTQLDVSILFLSSKTKIRLETDIENKPYLEDYFSNYGFTLKISTKGENL